MPHTSIHEILEELSMKYIMADISRPDDFYGMPDNFNKLLKMASPTIPEGLLNEIRYAFKISEKLCCSVRGNCEKDLEELGVLIENIQRNQLLITDEQKSSSGMISGDLGRSPATTEGPLRIRHPGELPAHIDEDLFGQFLSMQYEVLRKMESLILEFEQDGDRNLLTEFKRLIHTLKGEAGVLNLEDIGLICHRTEDLLDTPYFNCQILLNIIDWTGNAFNFYSGNDVKLPPLAPLLNEMDKMCKASHTGPVDSFKYTPSLPSEGIEGKNSLSNMSISSNTIKEPVRVDSEKLDHIIDMIGEMVITEAMVVESPEVRQIQSPKLQRDILQLKKITKELQMSAISLRMVPIKALFHKMGRVIRDLSKKMEKPVHFSMQGEEVELDKSLVDQLSDPLLHLVRNAVDHGIERKTHERSMAGKPEYGHVDLQAFHRGGSIVIVVRDDGQGLDREIILKTARKLKIIGNDFPLNDDEIYELIFEPGFSTAGNLTDISGRGVGMDVVRTRIQSLRGTVDVKSSENKGTEFTITLPLTLASIDGMIVRSCGARYIIPALSIITSSELDPDSITDLPDGTRLVKVQGELISLITLEDSLFAKRREYEGKPAGKKVFVVIESGGAKAAVIVDELIGQQHIVIKSLGEAMGEIDGISGGAILEDGSVGLILDVDFIVEDKLRSQASIN